MTTTASHMKNLAKQIKAGKTDEIVLPNSLIEFEDNGQDFLQWLVAPDGTILDCGPLQFSVWSKCKVVATSTSSKTGKDHVHIKRGEEPETVLKHAIASILPTTAEKLT